MTWFLIAVRQEVKRIDNSVVVHALELTIKPAVSLGRSTQQSRDTRKTNKTKQSTLYSRSL